MPNCCNREGLRPQLRRA